MSRPLVPEAFFLQIALWRERLIAMLAWGAFGAFATIFILNISQIALRVFGAGWIWVHDLSALLFAWTVMLGAGAAYGKSDHVVASVLIDRIPESSSQVLSVITRLIELSVALIILLASFPIIETRMGTPYVQLGIPSGWAYMSVAVLGVSMILLGISKPLRPGPREDFSDEALQSLEQTPKVRKEKNRDDESN